MTKLQIFDAFKASNLMEPKLAGHTGLSKFLDKPVEALVKLEPNSPEELIAAVTATLTAAGTALPLNVQSAPAAFTLVRKMTIDDLRNAATTLTDEEEPALEAVEAVEAVEAELIEEAALDESGPAVEAAEAGIIDAETTPVEEAVAEEAAEEVLPEETLPEEPVEVVAPAKPVTTKKHAPDEPVLPGVGDLLSTTDAIPASDPKTSADADVAARRNAATEPPKRRRATTATADVTNSIIEQLVTKVEELEKHNAELTKKLEAGGGTKLNAAMLKRLADAGVKLPADDGAEDSPEGSETAPTA